MKLKEILNGIEGLKVQGELETEITKLETDSRKVLKGDLFIAIVGFETDGHSYIKMAIEKGAKAIMVNEDKLKDIKDDVNGKDVVVISSKDTRIGLAKCACNYYGNPSRKLKMIGVTGTKGKTTTTFMLKEILKRQGIKTGLIGTVAEYINDDKIQDSDRTTPDALELQRLLNYFVEHGCKACVMEVSSQSLKLHRVEGIHFDYGIFTNFSEDHISEKEHPDMEDYFKSKLMLFNNCDLAFVNADDVKVSRVPSLLEECKFKTYGIDNMADILAKDVTITNSYVDFKVKIIDKNVRIKTGIPGRFSVYNSLAAISVALEMGCSVDAILEALIKVKVPGRSELVDNKLGLTIMIDYAHSPESLNSILSAVKAYTRGKVISVFGCGGDRDPGKRPQMGEISGRIADYTIITSDNPRTENPELIVSQIEEGMKKTNGKYEVVVNRTDAIKKAIEMAGKLDIIVLAGKGHETYQEINHVKNPYDEREIIKDIISDMVEE